MENEKFTPPNLNRFSMWQLQLDKHVVMINGKRNSGKSTLITSILYHHRHIRKIIVFSGSESVNKFYENLAIPRRFIKTKFDPVYLKQVYDMQVKNPTSCLIILDDLSFDDCIWKDPTLIDILYMGRHCKIGIIFAVQYIMHIPLKLRGQIDIFMALKDNSHQNQERLHKCFFSFIRKTSDFCQIFQHFTNDYGVLVADCMSVEHQWDKCMFWYKSDVIKERFHVGCERFKEYYDEDQQLPDTYLSDYEENAEVITYSTSGTPKKKKKKSRRNHLS